MPRGYTKAQYAHVKTFANARPIRSVLGGASRDPGANACDFRVSEEAGALRASSLVGSLDVF
jgi:hypothetical protein